MELVYMGKKNPKKVKITKGAITYQETFIPFKAKEVKDGLAKILLENAGDIFKEVGDRSPRKRPKNANKGYVGDIPADRLKDVDEQIKKDLKSEKGKTMEELADEGKKIKARRKKTKK